GPGRISSNILGHSLNADTKRPSVGSFTGKTKIAGYAAPGSLCRSLKVNPRNPSAGRLLALGSGTWV
ncbi:hypothetical protein PPH41_45090, partial [Burkholderia gladioli]|nr:hypothetical protein [Burkholderia gladioli]